MTVHACDMNKITTVEPLMDNLVHKYSNSKDPYKQRLLLPSLANPASSTSVDEVAAWAHARARSL